MILCERSSTFLSLSLSVKWHCHWWWYQVPYKDNNCTWKQSCVIPTKSLSGCCWFKSPSLALWRDWRMQSKFLFFQLGLLGTAWSQCRYTFSEAFLAPAYTHLFIQNLGNQSPQKRRHVFYFTKHFSPLSTTQRNTY